MNVVDENTVVEVGKFYHVQCAIMKNEYRAWYWVPIIGEPHIDKQFGFPDKHYHMDGRFLGRSHYRRLDVDEHGRTNMVASFAPSASSFTISHIVVKRLKCKRLTTGIKPPANAASYSNWYATMVGKSCAGKKCPHLGTKMFEQNSLLVCPLHNLKGCPTKEIIIPL